MATWLMAWMLTGCTSLSTTSDPLPYYESREFTPRWLTSNTVPADFHRIPAFSLTNQHADEVTESELDGKVTVASFFFTRCGGICPKLTAALQQVDAAFEPDADVLLLTHSVMPSDDTVPALRAFTAKHHIDSTRWHFLTGSRDVIYALGREAYFAEEDLGTPPDPDAFLHTENLVLVDQERHLRGIYNGLNRASVRQLIADVHQLLR